jgi:histidyl-tRNA synthetase
MYTFKDRKERSLTLRPEGTAPVVRAALENSLLEGEQRLFYLGPIFRYERPQRGRYRQSHQFGVECFGVAGPEADVEVISLAWKLIKDCGLNDVSLNINTIGDESCRPLYRKALLRYLKPHRSELSEESQLRLMRNPLRILDSKDPRDRAILQGAPTPDRYLCRECRTHFRTVLRLLTRMRIEATPNPMIVRGLDYYNRTVFEITSNALGAQNTLCGGGRYDRLVGDLGGHPVPAVGFALGLERLLLILEAVDGESAFPRSGIQVIITMDSGRDATPFIWSLRNALKVPVFADYANKKVFAQLKLADKNRAEYALITSGAELRSGRAVLRSLEFRTDQELSSGAPSRLVARLAKLLPTKARLATGMKTKSTSS